MTAVLAPISGQPRFKSGLVQFGAMAYFFEAGTTTPKTVFREAGLSTPHSHPIVVDGEGNFPPIYIGEGSYKIRATDSAGAILVEYDGLQGAIAPPTIPTTDPDDPVDPALLPATGDYKWRDDTNSIDKWVRCNGRTIGPASSGATERANADCEDLFIHLWNKHPALVVPGGRGTTAAADWAANKQIALHDARYRDLRGLDDMGNVAAGRGTGGYVESGTVTTLGAPVGRSAETLDATQIPTHNHPVTTAYADQNGSHAHTGTTSTTGNHNHTVSDSHIIAGPALAEGGNYSFADQTRTTSTAGNHSHTLSIAADGLHTHTLHVAVGNTGDGLSHNNVPPGLLATLYIKL